MMKINTEYLKEVFNRDFWELLTLVLVCMFYGMWVGGGFDEPALSCVFYGEGTEPGFVGQQIYVCEVQDQQGILVVGEQLEES